MATVAKTAYTAEQTAEMLAAYKASPMPETVEKLAVQLGKTVKSVVAKLSREGIYKRKEYISKTGAAPVKKDALADELAEKFGLTESEADSLTKANKTALQKILNVFKATEQVILVEPETEAS